jgi:hypothetical protein
MTPKGWATLVKENEDTKKASLVLSKLSQMLFLLSHTAWRA